MKPLFLISGFFLIFCLFALAKIMKPENDHLTFASAWLPYSADPMEYDASIHHNAFTSVFGTLTSAGKMGEVVPLIAKKWQHDDNAKLWSFEIKSDIFYSNGDQITAQDYALCLKRIAFLMRKADSHSGVMEYLQGFEGFGSIQEVESIYSNGNSIYFKFAEPMQDLPHRLAFGFYSLVHPSMYDNVTGEWLAEKTIISSHNYNVSKWTPDHFELSLRSDLKNISKNNHVKKISFVDLNKVKEASELKNIDIAVSTKQSLMFDESFYFLGSSEGFSIGYAQCYGWNDQKSPMSNINFRKWLRFKFYDGLKKSGLEPDTAFFPVSLYNGKFKATDFFAVKPDREEIQLTTHTLKSGPKIKENVTRLSMQEMIGSALDSLNGDLIKLQKIEYKNSMKIEEVVDLAINGTAIDADSFEDTARFMFVSKHGANLPDVNGKIMNELKKEKLDLDFINAEIWDQAVIWPILHYSSGHWINKNSNFNFKEVNFNLPALDFSFVKTE